MTGHIGDVKARMEDALKFSQGTMPVCTVFYCQADLEEAQAWLKKKKTKHLTVRLDTTRPKGTRK